jgi:hypothetical protein
VKPKKSNSICLCKNVDKDPDTSTHDHLTRTYLCSRCGGWIGEEWVVMLAPIKNKHDRLQYLQELDDRYALFKTK